MAKRFKVVFNQDKCKGCQLCTVVCPKKIIEMSTQVNTKGYCPAHVANEDECIGCMSCALMCPDCVIEIFEKED